MYIGSVQPFEDPLNNGLELFNELTVMGVGYHLFFLTDYMPDKIAQYRLGYSLIVVTSLNILINFGVIIISGVQSFVKSFKKFKLKKWPPLKQKIKVKWNKLMKKRQKKYSTSHTEDFRDDSSI